MAHAKYLTYTEYQDYGGAEPETAFNILEFKARKRIDFLTDSRVQNMYAVPEAVKLCAFALIGMINSVGAEAQASSPAISSFTTDGYTETRGRVSSVEDADKQMSGLIRTYLAGEVDDYGVPLLFRGCVYGKPMQYHPPQPSPFDPYVVHNTLHLK